MVERGREVAMSGKKDNNDMENAESKYDGFEGSRFEKGEEVEVVLRHPRHGGEMGRATGVLAARSEDVEVSRDGQEDFRKTLVWVKDLDGYKKPHPSIPGKMKEVDEAWFAEEAIRKKDEDVLDGVSFN
jgi:hypothetical protein